MEPEGSLPHLQVPTTCPFLSEIDPVYAPRHIIIIIIIYNNEPDIVIRDYEKGTCMLLDVAIPGDRNVIKKEAEKILKYKDLRVEIQRMWNVKTRVIPVIIGATGTISKSFRKYHETMKLRNYRKLPYWELHTHFVKC
jgi:hypothetical protein